MTKRAISATILSVALLATPALASVTFDVNSGVGFVGKGDVQTAFGWNNQKLQAEAQNLTFGTRQRVDYEFECERRIIKITQERTNNILTIVRYDARTHKQVDGFNLTGYGASITVGPPIVCPDPFTMVPGSLTSTPGPIILSVLDISTGDLPVVLGSY
jgi:hypothetical protein